MRKLLSFIVIGLLLAVNINLFRGSWEAKEKLKQVSSDQEKVTSLELTNANLREDLAERDSEFFIEKEARNLLHYGRPGETTIVLEDDALGKGENLEESQRSNFQKWVELLRI